MRALLAASLVAACAVISVHAAPAWVQPEGLRVEPRLQDRPTTEGLAKPGHLRAHHQHVVTMAAPDLAKSLPQAAPSKGAPLRIGFDRDVSELATPAATAAALEWERMADGSLVADIRIESKQAAALRAALRIDRLPDGATLRFHANDDTLFETTGREVNAAIRRNVDAGERGEAAHTYWSPVIDGESISVEIELPPGSDAANVALAIPRVSHLFTSAGTGFSTPTSIGGSGSCEVDASCSSSSQENSVAEMIFSDSTGSYLCTGTLLADQDAATNTPYFLSANHCISSQSVASTLTTYWFYRSSSCNSGTPGAYQQLTGGATLLYNTTTTDTSFMRLNNTPPQGAYYAGWYTSATPSLGTAITALHHPRGDLLKLSQGAIEGYLTCSAPSSGGFSCANASASSSTFYDVVWNSGIVEPGSSGSALFDGGYVVGQLYGGSGDCTTPGDDAYGRFDVAYNTALKSWLSPPLALSVTRAGIGTGTVASTPAGISCGATCSASFTPGTSVTLSATPASGSTFAGWSGACAGTGSCTVSMDRAQSVTATFGSTATLSVSTAGSGRVTSAPAGIDCGTTCSASFASGSSVVLTAVASTGSVFRGWSGACTGTASSCTLSMRGALATTASFAVASADVSLALSSAPASASAGKDAVFTLTATDNGPDAATNASLATSVPNGSQLVWLSTNCTSSGSSISCQLGTMASGASAKATVVVRPAAAGSITLSASVAALEADPASANNAASTSVSVASTPTGVAVPRYRLYSPVTQEHLYTTDLNEYNTLGSYVGTWTQEGTVGRVLDNPGSFNGVTATPYYRLYNTATGWHHWTADPNEYYTLIQFPNWNAEGVDGYILPTNTTGAEELYRLVYPDGRGLHHWTIDPVEYNQLITVYGWVGEGASGYVIQ